MVKLFASLPIYNFGFLEMTSRSISCFLSGVVNEIVVSINKIFLVL